MDLKIVRKEFTSKSTIGELYVDDVFECYTLEDRYRPDGPKVPHETCIPCGTYEVTIDFSNRFKRLMPHVLDVPNFSGIRIHSGNTSADTEGCILLGKTKATDRVDKSRLAFNNFFAKLDEAVDSNEPVALEIVVAEQASIQNT